VSTAGSGAEDSFMRTRGERVCGITLETRPALRAPTGADYDSAGSARFSRILLNRTRVRLCLPLHRPQRRTGNGAASPAAIRTTRRRDGPRTALRPAMPPPELRKRLEKRQVNGCFVWTKRIT